MRPGLALLALVLIGCIPNAPLPPDPAPDQPTTATPVASVCLYHGVLPDPTCTPGAADPRVTQDNLFSTICHPGYTATVRPPAAYTSPLKRRQMAEYGAPGAPSDYEEDHLVSLELGGASSDERNLWPEPIAAARLKNRIENDLHTAVCAGRLSLAEAQQRIASDWQHALE